eukprot:5505781-Amphidinium_carterae.2
MCLQPKGAHEEHHQAMKSSLSSGHHQVIMLFGHKVITLDHHLQIIIEASPPHAHQHDQPNTHSNGVLFVLPAQTRVRVPNMSSSSNPSLNICCCLQHPQHRSHQLTATFQVFSIS